MRNRILRIVHDPKGLRRGVCRILLRRLPHTLISWRFLLPCQGAVKVHKYVFLGAWPQLPRWLYAGVVLFSLCTWIGFWGWYFILLNLYRRGGQLRDSMGIAHARQVLSLLRLMARGVPAQCYYRFQLYRYHEQQWWHFVFDYQLPHWHRVLSGRISPWSQRLLSDKQLFADYMRSHRIPVVEHYLVCPRGGAFDWWELDGDTFLKPVVGSRCQGCFALLQAFEGREALLIGEGERFSGRNIITEKLRQLIEKTDYIVQPLLSNHPVIADSLDCEWACTLRVVTASYCGEVVPLLAILERGSQSFLRRKMIVVNISNGQLQCDREQTALQYLPYWPAVLDSVCRAHRLLDDVKTIGWDVIITAQGPVLLEGNINWGVAGHQVAQSSPLLDDKLMEVYFAPVDKLIER